MAGNSEFFELYRRPEWQKKRLEVMKTAGFKCQECGDGEKTLNVHHKYYTRGAKPWDYPASALSCLCEDCHELLHEVTTELKVLASEFPVGPQRALLGFLKGMFCLNRHANKKNSRVKLASEAEQEGFAIFLSSTGILIDSGHIFNWLDENESLDWSDVCGMSREAKEIAMLSGSVRHPLDVLRQQVADCTLCPDLFANRTQTVFGAGPIDPDVAFCGEAPGPDEDRQGEPFVGKAGQLLTRIITDSGLTREEVYIFNTLKCRPPGNRTPSAEECTNCRPFFERQFDLIRPKHLVALGGTAAKSLLQTATGITKLRGRVYEYRGVPLICTFHPSAILRDESGFMMAEIQADMRMLARTMGREVAS